VIENKKPRPSNFVEMVISAERHKQLQNIISYVKEIHYFIDPDMDRISLKNLEEFEWCFEGDQFEPEESKNVMGSKCQFPGKT